MTGTTEFVAFDLETTGLNPGCDRIVEIGAVRFDQQGVIFNSFDRLINPHQPSGATARAIHGISDEVLATAEEAPLVLTDFLQFLGDPHHTTLVAHHSACDAGFLGHELLRAGLPIPGHCAIDTLAWTRRRWPQFGSHRLDSLAHRFGFDVGSPHRALADSQRVRQIFLALRTDDPDPEHTPLSYPIHDGSRSTLMPCGWEGVAEAIPRRGVLWIEYAGGSQGLLPRAITPESFANRGGVAYLVATCHLDQKVKEFQVDRIRSRRLVAPSE